MHGVYGAGRGAAEGREGPISARSSSGCPVNASQSDEPASNAHLLVHARRCNYTKPNASALFARCYLSLYVQYKRRRMTAIADGLIEALECNAPSQIKSRHVRAARHVSCHAASLGDMHRIDALPLEQNTEWNTKRSMLFRKELWSYSAGEHTAASSCWECSA